MPQPKSYDRRRFLGAAAMATVAMGVAEFGLFGCAQAGSGRKDPANPHQDQTELSALGDAGAWLNSAPLTAAGLRGKVVLIDFWTYSCINWLRTLPYLRAWAEKYKEYGLTVIGIHTPEFPFEHDLENVRRAVKEMRVGYPVATDSDFKIWRAFNNEYWPALYLVDGKGKIRHHQFGEGSYDQVERKIQSLLSEAGSASPDSSLVSVDAAGAEAPADWADLRSQETYLGYGRTGNFASPGGQLRDRRRVYSLPARLALNQWGLVGDWTAQTQSVVLNEPNGRIAFRFHARDLHLVMGPGPNGTVPRPNGPDGAAPRAREAAVRFRVRIDGQRPGAAHGIDIDEQGEGTVTEPRMYQLIRQAKPIADRQFEIEFLAPGAEAFSITFG